MTRATHSALLTGLRRFIARRVPGGDVDDLLQDVLLRLQQADSDAPRDPTAWVYGVARHVVADHHRSRRRDPLAQGKPLGPDEAEEVSETFPAGGFARFDGDHDAHEEVLSWLRPMARELPDTYREAVLWADFEGVAHRRIAERLGIGLSAAKSRVRRGREHLRRAIEECCEIERDGDGRVTDFRRLRPCDC